MRNSPVRLESERYRTGENSPLTKHVVELGLLAKDAGSTPAASTISCWAFLKVLTFSSQCEASQHQLNGVWSKSSSGGVMSVSE